MDSPPSPNKAPGGRDAKVGVKDGRETRHLPETVYEHVFYANSKRAIQTLVHRRCSLLEWRDICGVLRSVHSYEQEKGHAPDLPPRECLLLGGLRSFHQSRDKVP